MGLIRSVAIMCASLAMAKGYALDIVGSILFAAGLADFILLFVRDGSITNGHKE